FYGAANRPVVAPVVSAAFALGCLALIWRVAVQKRGEELLILAALGICILPSALLIESPIRYPNMGRAALALPVMMLIAAWGLNLIAEIALGAVGNGEPANPPNNQNELAQI